MAWKGKRFSYGFYSNDVYFYLTDTGNFVVPEWSDEDSRWESQGLGVLKNNTIPLTIEEYIEKYSSKNYTTNWFSWREISKKIEEYYKK